MSIFQQQKKQMKNGDQEDILRREYRLHNTFLNVLTAGGTILAETTQLFKVRNGFL